MYYFRLTRGVENVIGIFFKVNEAAEFVSVVEGILKFWFGRKGALKFKGSFNRKAHSLSLGILPEISQKT